MRYAVRHTTVYEYGGEVVHSRHLVHLRPRESDNQRCLAHYLELDPRPSYSREGSDAFGNPIARLEYDRAHQRLTVSSHMQVEVFPRSLEPLDAAEAWDALRNRLSYHAAAVSAADLEACRFRMRSTHVPVKSDLREFAADCFAPGRPMATACEALTRKIYREFKYSPGATDNRTSVMDVLKGRRGVCQDFAHLMIAAVRSLGLAARYVSGYIRTVRSEGQTAIGGDASHAWVSVYCPPLGWVDFDPTNNCLVGADHVTVAWGRDFGDVSPLRGMIVGGGKHKLAVDVRVQPLP